MNAKENNQNAMKAEDRSLDEKIYQAMVELGWVFPQTVEEVEIAEEQMDQETAVPHTGLPTTPTAEDILKRMAAANSSAPVAEHTRQKQPLLPMLRQRAKMKASAIAECLEVTVTFLSDISSHSGAVPLRTRKEIARRATVNLPGITEQDVLDSFSHNSYEPIAAFRDKPFEEEDINYEKIVLRSDMSEERKRYWLSLAEEE
jgi:hypothetical protein